jgi:glycosyltransferase involved in cell wall biosynthesis
MISSQLFSSDQHWRKLCRYRPTVLAVFSFRYDGELVPDLVAHLETIVDGFVAFDDRNADQIFSNEPMRRRALIEQARELGASWVLAIDPDERYERRLSTRIRLLTASPRRVVWQFRLREMYRPDAYRVDDIWGLKEQGRLFPIFDGPFCSERRLHGAWCAPPHGYATIPTGLNLYHLKMLDPERRMARRDLYNYLDPGEQFQVGGYDYLTNDRGARLECIAKGRDFFPAHDERLLSRLPMPDIIRGSPSQIANPFDAQVFETGKRPGARRSQLNQFVVQIGTKIERCCDLSVVVLSLGAPTNLLSAVQSLLRQRPVPEIVVVNSGGGDAGAVLATVLDRIVLVAIEEPMFVGAARNIGLKESSSSFIAFLAADCIAEEGWVAHRLEFHANGAAAVSSAVVCSFPTNLFAQAAHLMTYCRRMPGLPLEEVAQYGASYDRALFEKHGLFSEYLRVAEDTDFHRRLQLPDLFQHSDNIRTVHFDPRSLAGLIKDQFVRGRRARYLYEYLAGDYGWGNVLVGTCRRSATAISLSRKYQHNPYRSYAIASWLLIPLATIAFLFGCIVSYANVLRSRRLAAYARDQWLVGDRPSASRALRKAIGLRPHFPPLDRNYWQILAQSGEAHLAAEHLFQAADMTRGDMWSTAVRNIVPPLEGSQQRPPSLTIVVFSSAAPGTLAELLVNINAQLSARAGTRIAIVRAEVDGRRRKSEERIRTAYGQAVDFFTPLQFQAVCATASLGFSGHVPDYVVVTTDDFVPSSDWLQAFYEYAGTMHEVDFFSGRVAALARSAKGVIGEMVYRLALIPRHHDGRGLFGLTPAMTIACRASVYSASGGLRGLEQTFRGYYDIRKAVLRTGGVVHEALGWTSYFRCDLGLWRLLCLSWDDGVASAFHTSREEQVREAGDSARALGKFWGMVQQAAAFSRRQLAGAPAATNTTLKRYLWYVVLFTLEWTRQAGRQYSRWKLSKA